MLEEAKLREEKEVQVFKAFLAKRTILIADTSASARSGIYNVFHNLGATANQLILVNSYVQADEQIRQLKPHVVVAEYELGRRCGLDLLQSQRQQRPDETKESLFVIITGNTSQSAVARAAEEDIDAYILKPFTPEVVRKTLMKAALLKIKPPEYLVKIDEGKKLMAEQKWDEADKVFNEASALDPTPSLAFYYLGQIKFLRQIYSDSRGKYEKGLEFNKIHYKCLVGLYDLLMSQKDHSTAYAVVKKISQYFPANPKRLSEVLRLAILNGKYEDIERYYTVFTNIDEKDEQLIKYVCASLVVCGKYYLSSNLGHTRALQLFQKAAATGSGRVKILREIILALVDHNLTKEARNFMAKFPPETQNSTEFALMRFLILNTDGGGPLVIDQGRQLLSAGVVDERLFAAMIVRSLEAGLVPAAEGVLQKAVDNYPDKKAYFEGLFEAHKPQDKKEKKDDKSEKKSTPESGTPKKE